jgi:hypothetical protein
MNAHSYCVSAHCTAPAEIALDFLADGLALGGWALGSFATELIDDRGTVRGVTLDTHDETFVRPVLHRGQGIVVYEVAYGENVDLDQMTPWIWAIVQPGDRLGFSSDSCVISMVAWRLEGMSDEAWQHICVYHDTEILLIKGQVERRARA